MTHVLPGASVPDYPYLRAWCVWLTSRPGYAEEQLAHARLDAAPEDAMFFNPASHRWFCWRELKLPDVRREIELLLLLA